MLQLIQKPTSPLPEEGALLFDDSSTVMSAAAASAANRPAGMTELTEPRGSDSAVAMEGVVGQESHGSHVQEGGSAAGDTVVPKV